MATVFQVFNENNVLQVDDDYPLFHRISTGTVTATASNSTAGVITTSIYNMVAFRCSDTSANVCMVPYGRSGNNVSYRFRVPVGAASVTVTYYIYSYNISDSGTFGLRVYNASGQIVLNSDYPLLRVLGSVLRGYNTASPAGTYAYSGKTVAVVAAKPWMNMTSERSGETDFLITQTDLYFRFASASQVVASEQTTASGTASSASIVRSLSSSYLFLQI